MTNLPWQKPILSFQDRIIPWEHQLATWWQIGDIGSFEMERTVICLSLEWTFILNMDLRSPSTKLLPKPPVMNLQIFMFIVMVFQIALFLSKKIINYVG